MKNKIVASDIDGCLNNQREVLDQIIWKHYKKIPNPKVFDAVEDVGFFGKDKDNFWKIHQKEVDNVTISPGSSQVLKNLRELGFKVVLITARPYNIAEKTEIQLKENQIEYDDILFNTGTKVDACKWVGAPMMVEDSDINIKALINGGIKALMPVCSYNDYLANNENVIPCLNWKDIYNAIIDFYA